jgi:hypothetical protein
MPGVFVLVADGEENLLKGCYLPSYGVPQPLWDLLQNQLLHQIFHHVDADPG